MYARWMVTGIVLGGLLPGMALARPSYNADCSLCHSAQAGRVAVSGEDKTLDLGVQLDGNSRGALKTFQAAPGQVVTLSVDLLDGSDVYAMVLKGMEHGGQQYSQADVLGWSDANGAGNAWTAQTGPPSYETKDDGSNGGLTWTSGPLTFTFDLLVDAATPPDVYDLTFGAAGKQTGRWYSDEHFYLQVSHSGDANGDLLVNVQDLSILATNWSSGATFGEGDFNNDQVVNVQDLSILATNWGWGGGGGGAVPEPVSLVLLSLGGIGLICRQRASP